MAPTTLTRHDQLGFHVRQTDANNIGAGTHKLGANDDGVELKVHFLKRNCQGHNCAKKNPEKCQFAKKLAALHTQFKHYIIEVVVDAGTD
jgi:hypothetical protein